jgi:uncharacterized protein (DUF1697 family)
VNVGGANLLPMTDLVQILESLGLENVQTYIQSGNAVFQVNEREAAALPEKIAAKIRRRFGFEPQVMLLPLDELESAMKANPYDEADSTPKALHLTFLGSAPKGPDLSLLEKIRTESERYSLKGRVFYFWSPEGVGKSKLFTRVEKTLGVACTARNWRTVCKLREMALAISGSAAGAKSSRSGLK